MDHWDQPPQNAGVTASTEQELGATPKPRPTSGSRNSAALVIGVVATLAGVAAVRVWPDRESQRALLSGSSSSLTVDSLQETPDATMSGALPSSPADYSDPSVATASPTAAPPAAPTSDAATTALVSTVPATAAPGELGPEILWATAAPDPVAAGAQVTIRWALFDVENFMFSGFRIITPQGTVLPTCGGTDTAQASGGIDLGEFTADCTLPETASSGTYSVRIEAADPSGNWSVAEMTTFAVIGSSTDLEPPTLIDTSIGPRPVSAGSAVRVNWTLGDGSGIGTTYFELVRPDGIVLPTCGGSNAPEGGTAGGGTFSQTCTISDAVPDGSYRIRITASDLAGNSMSAFGVSFTVSGGGGDISPPMLSGATLSPAAPVLNASFSLRWRLLDPNGVWSTMFEVTRSNGRVVPNCGRSDTSQDSGTLDDATFVGECFLVPTLPADVYTVWIIATDPAGNRARVQAADFTISV